MSPQIVQPQLLTNRRGNLFDSSTSLTGRFSAIFRDFPNTAGSGMFRARGGVAEVLTAPVPHNKQILNPEVFDPEDEVTKMK